jgi:hypothetical protein
MRHSEQLTQRQLDYIFTQLGYHLTEVKDGPRLWKNPEFDAVMLLPAIAPDQPVRQHHLMTLRRIAIEKGIIEPEGFDTLLEKARQHTPEPLPTHDAA